MGTRKSKKTTAQAMAAVFETELRRMYIDADTSMRYTLLSLAGKHPLQLSYLAATLSLYQTFKACYIHTIQPLYKRLKGVKEVRNRFYQAARVWKYAYRTLEKLKVPQEIHTFIKNHYKPPKNDNPMAAPKQPTAKQTNQINTFIALFPDTDPSSLPQWGFSTEPWTPKDSHRYDPTKGSTDTTKFGELAVETLNTLFILLDTEGLPKVTNEAYAIFKAKWHPKSARRKKKKTASR